MITLNYLTGLIVQTIIAFACGYGFCYQLHRTNIKNWNDYASGNTGHPTCPRKICKNFEMKCSACSRQNRFDMFEEAVIQ